MKITIFCCSPKQETSVTLQTVHFLQNMCKDDLFNIQMIGGITIFSQAHAEAIADADMVLFASPLMQGGLPSQLMYFLENMMLVAKDVVNTKPFSFIITGNKIMDETTIKYIKHFFNDNALKLYPILSFSDMSTLTQYGQNELIRWESYIKTLFYANNNATFSMPCNVAILDVSDGTDNEVNSAVMNTQSEYVRRGAAVNIISLRSFNILSCLSCESCLTTRKCALAKADDWENSVKMIFTNTNIVQFVGTLKHGMPNAQYKAWLDRFHKFGISPRHTGLIWSYLVSSSATDSDLECFSDFSSARNYFDGEIFTGVDRISNYTAQVNRAVTAFNTGLAPAESFLSAGMKLIYQKQAEEYRNVSPHDYKYYAKQGVYNPIMPNPAYAPVYTPESALSFRQARIMPYQMMINQMMYPGMYNQPMMGGQPMMSVQPTMGAPMGAAPGYGQPPYNQY